MAESLEQQIELPDDQLPVVAKVDAAELGGFDMCVVVGDDDEEEAEEEEHVMMMEW